jgi:arylsulfatase A-like enzyme
MKKNKQYNVIWIFGDQHQAGMLSCNGDPNVNTPNIDRLARQGLNFKNAVAGSPLCCPFRGSLLTSCYPHRCVPGHEYQMPPEMPTIATAFKDNDYHTAYFGKWHLDGCHEGKDGRAALHVVPPERRGDFDYWLGYENNNAQWDCWVHGTDVEEPYRLPGFETDCLTGLFIDHLKLQAETEKPFFAALSVQPPHPPYGAPEEWMRKHNPADVKLRANVPLIPSVEPEARKDIAISNAMVENLDWNVGRIIAEIEKAGLADNTYIMFFSDHGNMLGSHGQVGKTTPYAESLNIPFIISAAGSLGTRYQTPSYCPQEVINHVDIAPTTLGLCGIEKPDWMCGYDYSPIVRRKDKCENIPESAFIQQNIPTGYGGCVDRSWRGVITRDNWKYVCVEHQPWMLFNLNEDPYELVNLAFNGNTKVKRKELHGMLEKWIKDTGDEFALPAI